MTINATRQYFSYQLWQKQATVDLLVSDAVHIAIAALHEVQFIAS